jgi:hypothetical protein
MGYNSHPDNWPALRRRIGQHPVDEIVWQTPLFIVL